MMHTIALWHWGFVGSCVLCNICFASFIACSMACDISSSWDIVLKFCCWRWCLLFLDALLLTFCVAAASVLSFWCFLFFDSLSLFFVLQLCGYSQLHDISSYRAFSYPFFLTCSRVNTFFSLTKILHIEPLLILLSLLLFWWQFKALYLLFLSCGTYG